MMLASAGLKVMTQMPQSLLSWAATILTDGQIPVAQSDRITALINSQNIPWQGITERLKAKYGVERLRMLSKPQADEIERLLSSKATMPAAAPAG